jgi:hypothetical protein
MPVAKSKAKARRRSKYTDRFDIPLQRQVHAWIAVKDARDVLVRGWQDTEDRLRVIAKPLGMTLVQAMQDDLPEALTMRRLMRRIRAADRQLGQMAAKIVLMQPTSQLDALAMLEMALRIQHPLVCQAHAWELMNCGVGYLRDALGRTASGDLR